MGHSGDEAFAVVRLPRAVPQSWMFGNSGQLATTVVVPAAAQRLAVGPCGNELPMLWYRCAKQCPTA